MNWIKLSDVKLNQIINIIKQTYPPILGNLYNVAMVYYYPIPFLEDNNKTAYIKKGDRLSVCFTTKDISCTNASIAFLNVDNISLYTELNS